MPGEAATDSDREMIATRERPDIALQSAYKFHLDSVGAGGNEVADSSLQIRGCQRTSGRKKRISGAGRPNKEIGAVDCIVGSEGKCFPEKIHPPPPTCTPTPSARFPPLHP